jgi:hypothetical protein
MTFQRDRSRIALIVGALALRAAASVQAQSVDQEISTSLGPSVPGAFEFWVDANPSGNTATSIGTIQRCRRVVGSAGDTFTADIVAFNAPAFNGFRLRVAYDPMAIVVTDVDFAQKLTSTGLLLAPFPFTQWLIVDPGSLEINAAAGCSPNAPCGCTIPLPAGEGVLARITFEIVDPSRQSGIDIDPGLVTLPLVVDLCSSAAATPVGVASTGLAQVVLDAPAAPDRGCWTCNSVIDSADFDPGDGIADADPLLGLVVSTLRAAIVESNLHAGANRISFSTLPTPPTIVPAAPLLPLSDLSGGTTIDGSTQSGVTVDGSAAGGPGLKLLSSDNVIKLMNVVNCGTVAGILITGADADDNLIEGCRIGIDPADAPAANLIGVLIAAGASDNEIGSTSLGNVISGNTLEGVLIYHNLACDSSGHGESLAWLGAANVITDAGGDVDFSIEVPWDGDSAMITATATDPGVLLLPNDGNTSEFSACVAITPLIPCPADLDGSGAVNGLDLALLLGVWTGAAPYAPCPPFAPADFNTDCHINGLDLALLLGAWGPCL